MSEFDDLPAPLRGWLSKAALPWSVVSARRIWSKCLAKGLTVDYALQSLTNAENKTLARDRVSNF